MDRASFDALLDAIRAAPDDDAPRLSPGSSTIPTRMSATSRARLRELWTHSLVAQRRLPEPLGC